MTPHHIGGAVAVAVRQRGENGLVLLHGLTEPTAQTQLETAVGLKPFLQLQAFLFEKAVPGLLVDLGVERLVPAVVAIGVFGLDGGVAARVGLCEHGERVVADPLGGEAGRHGLELGHDLEHLDQFDRPRLAHKDAAAGKLLDQARVRKPLKCLADRRAGDVEALRELHLVQPLAIGERAVDDQTFELVGNDIRAPAFHGRPVAGVRQECNIVALVYKDIDPGYRIGACHADTGSESNRIWEEIMHLQNTLSVALAALIAGTVSVSAAELRLSHQWSENDVRHKVAQIVADEVAAADVDLEIRIFPTQSLFKAREQYTPLSRGQLDMTVLPLSYAGGQQPAYNLTLMPGLVKNHDHAARLNDSPFMAEIERIMNEDDVMTLVPGYLAGGFVGKDGCITGPDDVEGKQMRAAGKAFEQMLAGAGASIASMSSAEIYNAMQTGVLDAANTSSSSFVSYRIYEQASCYTPAGEYALWFMYQPLIMNKSTFDGLTDEQQAALRAGAEKATAFYLEEAKKEDAESRRVYEEAGVQIADMTEEEFNAWRALAQETSYKAFIDETPGGQELLDMALSVE